MANGAPQNDLPIVPLTEPPTPDIIQHIVTFHQAAILHDNALMRFHPPFTPSKTAEMVAWWTTRLSDAGSPSHHVFLALAPPSPILTSGAAGSGGQVVGVVDMLASQADTQYFRCDVEMLLVSPEFRNRGLAKRLMRAVEEKAGALGRTMLVLGTTRGSDADLYLYPRLGYKVFGRLPAYGETPLAVGGAKGKKERVDGVYYYKDLAEEQAENGVEGGAS